MRGCGGARTFLVIFPTTHAQRLTGSGGCHAFPCPWSSDNAISSATLGATIPAVRDARRTTCTGCCEKPMAAVKPMTTPDATSRAAVTARRQPAPIAPAPSTGSSGHAW